AKAAPTGSAKAPATAKATTAPSAKAPTAATAKPTATPTARASAAAPPAGSGAPKVAASGSAGAPPGRDPASMARIRSVPYERFVRACHVAAGNTKDLPAPELDAALKEFADFALPLSKTIGEANAYYQKEEFKTDDFAKGKEFHKKLTEGFAKLPEVLAKVDGALSKFKSANPIDTSAYTESQKLSDGVVRASADALMVLVARPWDQAKAKEAVTKLDAAIAPLRKYSEEHKEDRDPWVMLVAAPADSFLNHMRTLSETDPAEVKIGKLVNGITLFNRVHEGNNRALSRKLAEGAGGKPGLGGNNRNLRPKLPTRVPGSANPAAPQ
ncbi:MAG: DUF3829 domain-containing protein, partial [Polyangiaceae bacterium]|nr:DUF3829 domain-containing protein [Polyangiaceae bacterium]